LINQEGIDGSLLTIFHDIAPEQDHGSNAKPNFLRGAIQGASHYSETQSEQRGMKIKKRRVGVNQFLPFFWNHISKATQLLGSTHAALMVPARMCQGEWTRCSESQSKELESCHWDGSTGDLDSMPVFWMGTCRVKRRHPVFVFAPRVFKQDFFDSSML